MMEILLLVFCVWIFLSLRDAKGRITYLEDEITTIKLKFNATYKTTDKIEKTSNITVPNLVPVVGLKQEKEAVEPISEHAIAPTENIIEKPIQYSPSTPAYTTRPDIIKSPVDDDKYKPQYNAELEPFLPAWVMNSLTGGRLFVTLGMLILFIGVAMLFKYTAQYIVVPIELRFIGVALGALGMMYFGHSQINTRRDYGLYLHGGGLGILFLTVFVAFKFYALLSPSFAFLLLGLIGISTFFMSVKYDTMALAVLAITGGFVAPILTSTGQGSHIGLFSYYLLLNLIIFAIAWLKSWRVLNNVGFAFTFIIGLLWGGKYYVPAFYESVQAFLIVYFLLYVGIGILFASRNKPDISIPIDAASIFGVPLIGFGLQLALTRYYPHGHTISCLALGAFYSILSTTLRYSMRDGWKLLSEIFTWLSVLFFTLAIPFAFEAQTTAPLWAMEGVTMLWMMNRSKQRLYGYVGITLLALSNIFILAIINTQGHGTPFANGFFISAIISAIAHLFAAYFLHPERSNLEGSSSFAQVASIFGMVWWFGAGCAEIEYWLASADTLSGWLVFYSLSAIALLEIYKRFAVALFDKPAYFIIHTIIGMVVLKIIGTSHSYHPFMDYGYLAYATAFAAHYYYLWQNREKNFELHYVAAYITLVLLFGFELGYYLNLLEGIPYGKTSGWLLATLAGIVLLILPQAYNKWPITVLYEKYLEKVAMPLIAWAGILCLASFKQQADMFGSYIPVLNMIDMSEILTVFSFLAFYKKTNIHDNLKRKLLIATSIIGFLLINALMLRTFSHYLGFAYLSYEMFHYVTIQTSITILWTLIAMAAMLISSNKGFRGGWFAGAALLGVVVLKLFVVDLDGVGTISRIVSFMGVGLLTIALGYFSPVPAKK